MRQSPANPGRPATLAAWALAILILAAWATPSRAAEPASIATPAVAAPTLNVDDLRRGMAGYGMTVFEGTEPEPFTFEVVSVIRNNSPGRAVIWVRCTDERLVESGPVQGMSGSPMYVWGEGESRTPGEGGRLIGAFAFGYSLSKVCYVGVQPIAYMRELASRRDEALPGAAALPASEARRQLAAVTAMLGDTGLDRARLELASRLTGGGDAADGAEAWPDTAPLAFHNGRAVEAMRLPLPMGSPALAALAEPLLSPYGVAPIGVPGGSAFQGGGLGGPDGPRDAGLRPGAVLAVPMVMGDWEAPATGTVTDVLPDGSVLGFGHPMFGQGASSVPMASGYVHFVMPRLDISFKQASRLELMGTLTRDGAAGVVGSSATAYETADVRVGVTMPGVGRNAYTYRVTEVPGMTPTFAAIAALQSVVAVEGMPMLNTARMTATLRFDGGHELELDTLTPMAQPVVLAINLLAPTAMMTMNGFEPTRLLSADVEIDVERRVRMAAVTAATLGAVEVAPGERAEVAVTLQPYGEPPTQHAITLDVPPDTPEGDYFMLVGGPQMYLSQTLGTRPHLFQPASIEELTDTLQRLFSVKSDALYAVLQLPAQGLAVGRQELPGLPSSRAAIFATPTTTRIVRYPETLEAIEPMPFVPVGGQALTISVRRPRGAAQPAESP